MADMKAIAVFIVAVVVVPVLSAFVALYFYRKDEANDRAKSPQESAWDHNEDLRRLKGICDFMKMTQTEVLELRHRYMRRTDEEPRRLVIPGGRIFGMKIEISDEVARPEVRR